MRKLDSIKAVSFDADGTLWDFEKVMRHSLEIVLRVLVEEYPDTALALTVDRMRDIRGRTAAELAGKETNLEAVRLESFRRTLEWAGTPDDSLAVRLNDLYLRHRFEDIELYPDVLPVLDYLKSRYRLGLLSNGNSYPERCGLDGVFGFVVFSQEIGVEKPAPGFFRIALERSGLRPDELIHVGDSLESDVLGAAGSGIRSIWLNRADDPLPPGVEIDCQVRSLLELKEIL